LQGSLRPTSRRACIVLARCFASNWGMCDDSCSCRVRHGAGADPGLR
jgi:hypothetical protein